MKIVFLINSLSQRSGSERVACNLANLLSSEYRFNISILNRDTNHQNSAYSLNKDIQVLDLSGNYFQFYSKIFTYIRKNKPDFILVHNMGKLSLLASLLKKDRCKIISLEHVAFISRSRWLKIISPIFYRRINSIVTLTQNDLRHYKNWHSNVCCIPNLSPFQIEYMPMSKENKIIAIGRLTYQKNFKALLEVWKIVYQNIPNWKLEIYGEGEELSVLKEFICNNELKNVDLMGNTEDIEDIYKKSAILVMTSKYEGLPMVLIEAQSFGIPIVSFNCPYGPSEIIEQNYNGILIKNEDIDSFAHQIIALTKNNDYLDLLSRNSLESAKKFSKEVILERWKNLFCNT